MPKGLSVISCILATSNRIDELDALLDNEINHICALHERKCHVHTEGLVGHFVHLGDFTITGSVKVTLLNHRHTMHRNVPLSRDRLDDAFHRTCV